jgi:hypothetical protein
MRLLKITMLSFNKITLINTKSYLIIIQTLIIDSPPLKILDMLVNSRTHPSKNILIFKKTEIKYSIRMLGSRVRGIHSTYNH